MNKNEVNARSISCVGATRNLSKLVICPLIDLPRDCNGFSHIIIDEE